GKTIPAPQDGQLAELRMAAQFGQGDRWVDASFEFHVDHEPARVPGGCPRVMVRTLRIESRRIRICFANDADDADYSGFGATRVIEERQVADAHRAEMISRLVVAHSIPVF